MFLLHRLTRNLASGERTMSSSPTQGFPLYLVTATNPWVKVHIQPLALYFRWGDIRSEKICVICNMQIHTWWMRQHDVEGIRAFESVPLVLNLGSIPSNGNVSQLWSLASSAIKWDLYNGNYKTHSSGWDENAWANWPNVCHTASD